MLRVSLGVRHRIVNPFFKRRLRDLTRATHVAFLMQRIEKRNDGAVVKSEAS